MRVRLRRVGHCSRLFCMFCAYAALDPSSMPLSHALYFRGFRYAAALPGLIAIIRDPTHKPVVQRRNRGLRWRSSEQGPCGGVDSFPPLLLECMRYAPGGRQAGLLLADDAPGNHAADGAAVGCKTSRQTEPQKRSRKRSHSPAGGDRISPLSEARKSRIFWMCKPNFTDPVRIAYRCNGHGGWCLTCRQRRNLHFTAQPDLQCFGASIIMRAGAGGYLLDHLLAIAISAAALCSPGHSVSYLAGDGPEST